MPIEEPLSPVRRSPSALRGSAAARAHATLAVGLAFCALAFWFEFRRAEGGNSLSWAYVFEWPLLAVFAVYMWWKMIHPDGEVTAKRSAKKAALAPEFDGMLQAWEQSQRDLHQTRAGDASNDSSVDTERPSS
ncbi:MAG TPA: hypothetical protein VMU98_05260 [Acidimicrobiales bacterium]|nr:hypothetical protein [Acidimicrobiales bacterium]